MLTNIKALIVVLAVALTIFALARPLMLRYVDPVAYARRRMIWVAITVLGFTCPSIWLYALIAMPLMYWASSKDENPLALYVILAFAIPNARVQIPVVGIGQLMELNHSRMMSLAILVPLMMRASPIPGMATARKWTIMDAALAGLGLLQLALIAPYESVTATLREGSIFFLDTFVMFYVFARVAPSLKTIREIVASLTFTFAVLAALGIAESARSWLFFTGIGPVWGAIEPFTAYISRGSILRAQASTGHSLALGYLTSMGVGLAMYLSSREPRLNARVATFAVLVTGVFVSGSRGAWITSMIVFVVYTALRPGAGRFLAKVLPIAALVLVVAYNSPLKESVIDKLPIIGHTDQDTVEYRQLIAEVSWRLIKQNPFFGDPFALRNMEELRQGQGIIDIMNGYANVAVFNGGVGFVLFVTTFLIAIWRTFLLMRECRATDPDMAALGADMIACLVASLVFIGTAAVHPATYWITGLMAGYCAIGARRQPASVFTPAARRFQ